MRRFVSLIIVLASLLAACGAPANPTVAPASPTVAPAIPTVRATAAGSTTTATITPPPAPTNTSAPTATPGTVYARNVYVLVFDPILQNGRKLSVTQGWNSYRDLTTAFVAFMTQASGGRVLYNVAFINERNDLWLMKEDGFSYTEAEYLAVLAGQTAPHRPDTADYHAFLTDPAYDICGKLNRGEIDEIWLFAAPWFGFYESRLVGPGGYEYNAPPLELPGCERLAPIMGFNYERGLEEMVEDFGHRSEAVLTELYGGWEQNRTAHNWDRFALSAGQSPSYTYAGCGSIHYAPNAREGYDVSNPASVLSNCASFWEYPNLGVPLSNARQVSCSDWGCTRLGYFAWWLGHLPDNPGRGPDGWLNDWWAYIINPSLVHTDQAMSRSTPMPTAAPSTAAFTNLTAELPGAGPAKFSFKYSGRTSYFIVTISTLPDMSWDVYLSFATGAGSPLVRTDPAAWAKYRCGVPLYWRVEAADGTQSGIQTAYVDCSAAPPTSTTAPGEFSELTAELPGAGPAKFSFKYSGQTSYFIVTISTLPDMSWDVYLSFATGAGSPLVRTDPAAWAKYRCGVPLYWRVEAADGTQSEIQSTMVACP